MTSCNSLSILHVLYDENYVNNQLEGNFSSLTLDEYVQHADVKCLAPNKLIEKDSELNKSLKDGDACNLVKMCQDPIDEKGWELLLNYYQKDDWKISDIKDLQNLVATALSESTAPVKFLNHLVDKLADLDKQSNQSGKDLKAPLGYLNKPNNFSLLRILLSATAKISNALSQDEVHGVINKINNKIESLDKDHSGKIKDKEKILKDLHAQKHANQIKKFFIVENKDGNSVELPNSKFGYNALEQIVKLISKYLVKLTNAKSEGKAGNSKDQLKDEYRNYIINNGVKAALLNDMFFEQTSDTAIALSKILKSSSDNQSIQKNVVDSIHEHFASLLKEYSFKDEIDNPSEFYKHKKNRIENYSSEFFDSIKDYLKELVDLPKIESKKFSVAGVLAAGVLSNKVNIVADDLLLLKHILRSIEQNKNDDKDLKELCEKALVKIIDTLRDRLFVEINSISYEELFESSTLKATNAFLDEIHIYNESLTGHESESTIEILGKVIRHLDFEKILSKFSKTRD